MRGLPGEDLGDKRLMFQTVLRKCKEPELKGARRVKEQKGNIMGEARELKVKVSEDIMIEVPRSHSCRNLAYNFILSINRYEFNKSVYQEVHQQNKWHCHVYVFLIIWVLSRECIVESTEFIEFSQADIRLPIPTMTVK